MKSLKKMIKLCFFCCLILLACLGIGIAGGVPIPFSGNRKDTPDIKIELVESQEEEADVMDFEAIG